MLLSFTFWFFRTKPCYTQIHDKLDGGKHKAELEEAEFQQLEARAQEERKREDDLAAKVG